MQEIYHVRSQKAIAPGEEARNDITCNYSWPKERCGILDRACRVSDAVNKFAQGLRAQKTRRTAIYGAEEWLSVLGSQLGWHHECEPGRSPDPGTASMEPGMAVSDAGALF